MRPLSDRSEGKSSTFGAFLCFAGDAAVVFASLLVAFWLRFDTAVRDFGVEMPGILLSIFKRQKSVGSGFN